MSAEQTSDSSNSSQNATIDRNYVGGMYAKNWEWRDKLNRLFTYRALDIPLDDDMNNVGNRNGMTWRELLAIGALLGAGYGVAQFNTTNVTPEPAPPVASTPADAGYDIVFYDSEGNQIQLDRWQGTPE